MSDLIRHHQAAGHHLRGIGVVVGSLIDPERIRNDHIKIHALEGQLFRGVVSEAAALNRLPCGFWRERDVYASAATIFERSEPDLRTTVASLGRTVSGPWRREEKAAALAAWLVLAGQSPAIPKRRLPASTGEGGAT